MLLHMFAYTGEMLSCVLFESINKLSLTYGTS